MIAELLNEYCEKAHVTSGTFTHNGQALSPMDTTTLSEAGFKNNSEVTVTQIDIYIDDLFLFINIK